ncbi:MAG TPA: hypothetical protein PLD54_04130 [Candidatus Levybacteria bacterium]|nr:hypothetical protein [Candidatus Levybacteria bacterium]
MPKQRRYNYWQQLLHSESGQMGIGSLIFYATSILIVLSIPITVVLLRTNQEQITTASFSPVSFSSPPTLTLELPISQVKRGDTVQVRTVATNTNWSIVYFSPQYPTIPHPYFKNTMTVVAQGANIGDSYFTAQEPGYFMAATFQLQGAYGEFKSGDLMCTWNGEVYLYRKETVNPIIEMIDSDAKYRGDWDKLTTCQNVSLKRIEVQ